MNSTTDTPVPVWLPIAIIGGLLVIFPLFWCGVVWLISRIGGWHRLALRHAAGDRPVTGKSSGRVTAMVGCASYRGTLTLHFNAEGFFMEVMPLFKMGHPRLFIPWSEISARTPQSMLWYKTERLSIGQPVVATLTLPAKLLEEHGMKR